MKPLSQLYTFPHYKLEKHIHANKSLLNTSKYQISKIKSPTIATLSPCNVAQLICWFKNIKNKVVSASTCEKERRNETRKKLLFV